MGAQSAFQDDPLQPGAAVETPVVEFQSRAVPLGITVEYTFTLGNRTEQPVEFDIPHLNWSGFVAAGGFREWSIVAPHTLASLVRSRAELLFADGSRISGPVELSSPVPAPMPVYLSAAILIRVARVLLETKKARDASRAPCR